MVAHNWYASCAKCGERDMKRNMIALRIGNYNPKLLCWLCQSCFCALLDELEVCM